MRCSGCTGPTAPLYCSKPCQKTAWKGVHKWVCGLRGKEASPISAAAEASSSSRSSSLAPVSGLPLPTPAPTSLPNPTGRERPTPVPRVAGEKPKPPPTPPGNHPAGLRPGVPAAPATRRRGGADTRTGTVPASTKAPTAALASGTNAPDLPPAGAETPRLPNQRRPPRGRTPMGPTGGQDPRRPARRRTRERATPLRAWRETPAVRNRRRARTPARRLPPLPLWLSVLVCVPAMKPLNSQNPHW